MDVDVKGAAFEGLLEKAASERSEYGIERDEGLVADLRLFARVKEQK